MENPPAYEDACKVDEQYGQRVTLALVVPPPSPADTLPGTPEKDNESDTSGPPPAYEPLDDDKKPLLVSSHPSDTDGWSPLTLEDKLVQAGLLTEDDLREDSGSMLGGDLMFSVAFFISFLFSWIGFLLAYCMSSSVAGRYGALSGFGASMVKWTIIAAYTECCGVYLKDATCLLIALVISGLLLFGRGIYMYIKIKRQIQSSGNIQYMFMQNL